MSVTEKGKATNAGAMTFDQKQVSKRESIAYISANNAMQAPQAQIGTGPARAARTRPVPIWPRTLQRPLRDLPHEFHIVRAIFAYCSSFETIIKVNLLASFFFDYS